MARKLWSTSHGLRQTIRELGWLNAGVRIEISAVPHFAPDIVAKDF